MGPGSGAPADPLLTARAMLVHDLAVSGTDRAELVDVVDEVVRGRRWWVEQWPQGAEHVAGQVAQDAQEALLDRHGLRWPRCPLRHEDEPPSQEPHELHVRPDLGPDPHWVCESSGVAVAPLGGLPAP